MLVIIIIIIIIRLKSAPLVTTIIVSLLIDNQYHSSKMPTIGLQCLHVDGKMANAVLKQVFQALHPKIVASVNPDSMMDVLFSKAVIGSDDYQRLRQVPVPRDRCRDMLSLLHNSLHPQTFIHLRLALVDLKECWWIVDEIDKKLPSLTTQLQQLHLDQSTDGKHLLRYDKSV